MGAVKLLSLAVLIWSCAATAAAQEYGAGFGRFMGHNEDRARYSASEQFGDRGPFLWRQEAEASQTVYRSSPDVWTVSGRAGELGLGAPPVVLPQSGVVVPTHLWHLQGGGGYTHEIGDRRRWGASAALGSASDRPFLTWRDDQAQASAYYQMPSRERNSWIFLLNYSNNRSFANNVPLPGFAYVIDDPKHRLNAIVGFPFLFARWRADDDWTLSAGVFGGASYFFETSRRLSEPVSLYARFERTPQQWLRAGRTESRDRLIFDSKSAVLGMRAKLAPQLSLEASAGRVFDRRFFESRDASHSGGIAKADLANATVLQTALAWRWGRAPAPSLDQR
jgi:hypothetical protein